MIRRNTILLSFFITILVFSVSNISSMPQQNLNIIPTTYAGSDGYENDNSFANASTITAGITQTRTLGLYDKDYIQFTPTPGIPLYQVTVNANVSYVTAKVYDLNQTFLYSMAFETYGYTTQKVIFNGPVYIVMSYYSDLASYSITVSTTTIADSNEPDNTLVTATTIAANTTSTLQAIPLGDVDTYVYQNGPIDSVVKVLTLADMTQPGYDTTLTILDSVGNQVYYNDDYNGTLLSGMTFFAAANSLYYFQVSHYTSQYSTSGNYIKTYQLRVRVHTFHPDSYEPMDLTGGVLITKNQSIKRNIKDTSDHDIFYIQVNSSTSTTLNFSLLHDDSLSVDLYDPAMTFIQTLYVYSSSHYLQFTASITGNYTLDIYGDHFIPYTVNYFSTVAGDAAEPNGSNATAYPLSNGSYSFSFFANNDVDYYLFNVTQASTYIVQFTTLMDGSWLNYSLIDSYGNFLQSEAYMWIGTSGQLFLPMNSGIYYLVLQSGSYSTLPIFNYTLSVQIVPDDINNDFNHASYFATNSTIDGIILPNDYDYYSFTLNQSSVVNITVVVPSMNYIVPDMDLYNSSYSYLTSAYYNNINSNQITNVLDAGTYYLALYNYGSYSPYNVSLNVLAVNTPTTTTTGSPTTTDTSTSTTTTSSSSSTASTSDSSSSDGGNSTQSPAISLPGFQIGMAVISISAMIAIDRKRTRL